MWTPLLRIEKVIRNKDDVPVFKNKSKIHVWQLENDVVVSSNKNANK